ncbi:multidrug resistance protein MdtN [Gimesia panareensis]|uniref:Multidrug resistance protein MdtN n=1 Tax=Gimesia panareensis TaxID=2527978 RepID=A0A517Q6Z2_9PLAN|nr:efflux RND transporter periplasmic adaptor subunit [Gimesia panareensis]QDT27397.1 multidrug resistance protein MdtN [Gimesia panareensis]
MQTRQAQFFTYIRFSALSTVLGVTFFALTSIGQAQQPTGDQPETAFIEREAITLRHPRDYYVPLNLKPVRELSIASPIEGVIHSVDVQPGDKPATKAVLVRLEAAIPQAEVARAQAALVLAREEQKNATGKAASVAKANVALAEAELNIANIRLEQTTIRAPFEGEVFRVLVSPGAYVRAGDPLLELGDTSKLKVEIPLARDQALAGNKIDLSVEDQATQGTVNQVLPLAAQFEKLRDLASSITSAVVVLDNKENQFRPGQSVSVNLIPRYPIAEIPTVAVKNSPEGERKIQVIRENVIRELKPQILGQVGPERLYVSAAFNKDDEIVVSSTQPLVDGASLQPVTTVGKTKASSTTPTGSQPAKPPEKKVSF